MKTLSLAISCLCASMSAHAVGISGQGTWETTLQARDLDGDLATAEAYYDTALSITWLADANYAKTTGFDDGGSMYWSTAVSWVAGLNPYSSISGWRLPTVTDTGSPGCDYAYSGTDCGFNVDTDTSEMSHMHYITLGNTAYYNASGIGPQPGWDLVNTGPFSNVQDDDYWSATEYAPDSSRAWNFHYDFGDQGHNGKENNAYAWAVHDGDVGTPIATSAVPLPASFWLLGSGLVGLVGVSRKKSAQ